MAIKVSGTTVIDDSRGLINIASVDATTATAITEAGVGGGGTHEFVASGAISTGDVVVLNSDGTVSIPSYNDPSVNSKTVVDSSYAVNTTASVYDSTSNKIIVVYNLPSTAIYYAVVGSVEGNNITFGTPVSFDTSSNGEGLSIAFDSSNNRVVVAYRDTYDSNYGKAVVGTVSGTSISFGTPVTFNSRSTYYTSAIFDSNSNKVIIAYQDVGNSSYGTAIVGTVSGTSISFGTATVFESANSGYISATFDSNSNKVVIAYQDSGNSGYGTSIVGTVSGTSISFGTAVVFNSANSSDISSAFDSNSNKVVIAYRNFGNSLRGTAIVGTVSGTSISFGSAVVFDTGHVVPGGVVFDNSTNRIIISYVDISNNYYGTVIVGTVSGLSISFGTAVVFQASTNTLYISSAFNSASNKVVVYYSDGSNSFYLTSVIVDSGQTTAASYIGIAAENIADTATGEVTIIGGVNEQTVNSYDLANASYDSVSFSLAGLGLYLSHVVFKPDGTKMYIAVDDNGEDVKEYDLSSAWDVSTASYVQRFILSSQIIYPFGLFFKPDGTKMYVSDPSSQDINEYSLSSAWNISTASYTQSFSVSGNISFNTGLFFKPDGTKMYVVDYIIGDVNEYSLSSAWDIATASYTQNFSISGQETLATGLFFDSSGSKMFITGQSGDDVNEYSLSSAWNISTASYIRNFSVASQASSPTGISFKPDGTKMYIVGSVTDTVYQYTTGTFGGFTTNSSYFVADDGSLTITNNGRKIGKALSASELQVKTKLTGSEMNEYLGGLV